jgi:hypothetical protein
LSGPDVKPIQQTAQQVKESTIPLTGTANASKAAWEDWSKWSGKMSGMADIANQGWFGTAMQRAGGNMQELLAGSAPEVAQRTQAYRQQLQQLDLNPATSGDSFLREYLRRSYQADVSNLLAQNREAALGTMAGAEQAYRSVALQGGGLAQNYLANAANAYGNVGALLTGTGQLQGQVAQAQAQRQANKMNFWSNLGSAVAGTKWFK